MFLTFSKTIGRFGGFRLGVGTRITKNNAWYMLIFVFFMAMFKLSWYGLVAICWLIYAMCYGTFWLCKKTGQLLFHTRKIAKDVIDENQQKNQNCGSIVDATAQEMPETSAKNYCPKCGTELKEGNLFCVKCGNKLD